MTKPTIEKELNNVNQVVPQTKSSEIKIESLTDLCNKVAISNEIKHGSKGKTPLDGRTELLLRFSIFETSSLSDLREKIDGLPLRNNEIFLKSKSSVS